MNYQEQLQRKEWKSKRIEILERDNFSCRNCGCKRSIFLRLSSKYGIKSYHSLRNNKSLLGKFRINQETKKVKFIDVFNKFLNIALFVTETNEEIILDNLKFALQNDENGVSKRLICFTENISEDDKFTDLNIHHKYYITGRKAWEYNNEALITLCADCHKLEHENKTTPVYDSLGTILYNTKICNKCSGSGFLPEFHYYEDGICFKCGGHGAILDE